MDVGNTRCLHFPECPSTLLDAEELCQRLEELQALLKTEAEPEDEPLDIVGVAEPACQLRVKQEELGDERESHFYLVPSATSHFVRDAAQQVGTPAGLQGYR